VRISCQLKTRERGTSQGFDGAMNAKRRLRRAEEAVAEQQGWYCCPLCGVHRSQDSNALHRTVCDGFTAAEREEWESLSARLWELARAAKSCGGGAICVRCGGLTPRFVDTPTGVSAREVHVIMSRLLALSEVWESRRARLQPRGP
jgi:hypothetical protein